LVIYCNYQRAVRTTLPRPLSPTAKRPRTKATKLREFSCRACECGATVASNHLALPSPYQPSLQVRARYQRRTLEVARPARSVPVAGLQYRSSAERLSILKPLRLLREPEIKVHEISALHNDTRKSGDKFSLFNIFPRRTV